MKILKWMRAVLAPVLLASLIAMPAGASTTDMELRGDASGLVLLPPGGKLFDLQNMVPGDTRTAKLTINNSYNRYYDLWMHAEIVENPEPGLLAQLVLTAKLGDETIYEGSAEGFPSSANKLHLGRFQPGQGGELTAAVHLPGPETGNEYQGTTARVNWIFTAQASGGGGGGGGGDYYYYEPEPPGGAPEGEQELVIEPERPGVMPKTGVAVPYPYYLFGGLALLSGTLLFRKTKRRH